MRAPNLTFGNRLFSTFTIAIALLATVVATTSVQADDLGKPSTIDRLVSKMVASLMQEAHLSKRSLDDTVSQRAFDMYIKNLDPMKAYFMQSDIDEFKSWQTELDDQMKVGEFTAAFAVFKRFLERIDQRTELALEMIDTDHDFSVDEEIVTDPDMLEFAKDETEARENWRKRIKFSLLVLKGDDSEEDTEAKSDEATDAPEEAKKPKKKIDPKELLRKRYTSFARRMHQVDSEDLVERFITAVTNCFDPHTSYMSKKSFENFMIQMQLELEGIGATLQATDDGYTVIKNIVPGGAAATQGGLNVEDKIVAVGQGDEEEGTQADAKLLAIHGTDFVDVTGMKLDDVVGMIRGKAGTIVRLSVLSENDSELHTVKIVREKIKLEDSAAQGTIFEDGQKADGNPYKIGVIELPSFYADMEGSGGRRTTTDVLRILEDFNKKSVDALVLDLRANGGGSLREAIDCTGLFIDVGPVVQVKNPFGTIEKLNDEAEGMAWEKPLIVLTSKFSASASEILAGAVQDYDRGIVIGDTTTHGKGTVQSLMDLSRQFMSTRKAPPNMLGALKITTQQFYRPNGDSTQKRGVLSDLILPSITDKMDVGESDLEYPVEFDRVPRAQYSSYDMRSPEILSQLQTASQDRVASSDKFQERVRKIQKYVEQKDLKTASLNEDKFMARRKELNAEKEDRDVIEDQLLPSKEIKRDFYMDEVLRITNDYMKLLGKQS